MTLLSRQLFKEFISVFAISLLALLSLVIIGRAVQLRDMFLGLVIGPLDTIMLFIYMIPVSLLLIIPVACMLAVFLTFLRMSTDRELIALRAGGVHILQMLYAPVIFSLICTALTLWVSLFWLGFSMEQFRTRIMDIATTRARIVVQAGVFNTDFPGLTLFARQVHPETGQMAQVLVDDKTHPKREVLLLAPSGLITMDYEEGDVVFRLENGNIYSMNDKGASVLAFEGYQVRLPVEKFFKGLRFSAFRPQDMRWSQLIEEKEKALTENDTELVSRLEVEQQKRLAYPLACLVLTLFAIPLAVAFQGMHRQMGMMFALGTFFIYYFLMSIGFSLGELRHIPPTLGLWFPNALFFAGALYGLHATRREQLPQIFIFWQKLKKSISHLLPKKKGAVRP